MLTLPAGDLFSQSGIAWLKQVPLEKEEAQGRASDLRLLEQTERVIAAIDERLVRISWEDEKVRPLMSVQQIDYIASQTLLAAIGAGRIQGWSECPEAPASDTR